MFNPIRWLDANLFTPHAEWVQRREAVSVEVGHEGLRRMGRWAFLRWIVGISALTFYKEPYMPGWVDVPLFLALCVFVVVGSLCGLARAHAYRSGWIEGRQRMWKNSKNHDNPMDWIDAEANFDTVHVLGLPPIPHPADPRWEQWRRGEGPDL